MVRPVFPSAPTPSSSSQLIIPAPSLHISTLRPTCPVNQRIFQWQGINPPPAGILNAPLILHIRDLAAWASLRDSTSYGSGIRKFHIFRNIFSVPEAHRLPASFDVLHSFVLWATADPAALPSITSFQVPMEPVAVSVARKYLTVIRAWHIAQGWPPPLSQGDHETISWSLRGMDCLQQARHKKPPCPPITIAMLTVLGSRLDTSSPFDACIWAMAACAFWGMMQFGEVSVDTQSAFDDSRHLKRCDAIFGADMLGTLYVKLVLPSAKTEAPGKTQSVFMTKRHSLCPITALPS